MIRTPPIFRTLDRWKSAGISAGILVLLFICAAAPLIAIGYDKGRAFSDQNGSHLPAIRQFAQEWPHPNLANYRSATTPGYHLLLAAASRLLHSTDERLLRALGAVFTIGLLITLAIVAGARGTVAALILCLPVLTSLYIFSSGVWLLPDNAHWLGVCLIILLALRRRVDRWTYLAGAALVLALVAVRQIDLWVMAPFVVSAWLGSRQSSDWSAPTDYANRSRARRAMLMIAAAIPTLAMLGIFVHLWHGLVPPLFQPGALNTMAGAPEHSGGNVAYIPIVLATFAIFIPFYAGWIVPRPWHVNAKRDYRAIVSGVAVGLAAGILPRTDYDMAAGRWSGLWNVARFTPTIAHRAPAIALLSAIGGGMLGWLFAAIDRRDRWVFLAAGIAFIAAQCANHQAWQRYIDPFVLIILILAAARATTDAANENVADAKKWNFTKFLPAALGLLLAIMTVVSLQ